MSGSTNRRRGHQFERDVARELATVMDLDVRTSRSVTGGTQHGADLVTVEPDGRVVPTVEGWSVEVKASTDGHEPTLWMRQAKTQADSDLYAVVAKIPNKPLADATVYLTPKALRWWMGDGLAAFEPAEGITSLSFSAWCVLLTMDLKGPA